jgi:translation initiation factor 1
MAGSLGDLLKKAGLAASPEVEAPPAAEEAPAGPAPWPKRLLVRFERKGHGGKTVTVISGLLGDHDAVLGRLRTELGVGGRVDGEDLVVQGNQVERVARWFESQGIEKVQRN